MERSKERIQILPNFRRRNTNLDVTLERLLVNGGILAEVAAQGALLQVHGAHVAAQREQVSRGVVAGCPNTTKTTSLID